MNRHEVELFDSNNPNDVGGREPMNDQLTIISMLCWSALQLESYVDLLVT